MYSTNANFLLFKVIYTMLLKSPRVPFWAKAKNLKEQNNELPPERKSFHTLLYSL